MQWLIEVLNGTPGPEAAEHLRAAFIAWFQSGEHEQRGIDGKKARRSHPGLARFLRVPENPELARLKVRDWYLRQASELVHADYSQRYRRAVRLHAAAQHFMARQWPCWWHLKTPPSNASKLEALLWHAAQAGSGRLPTTARRYAQLLEE